jgi:hypothetical protein
VSEPIKAGDLVVVVRVSHPCADRLLGRVRRLGAVLRDHDGVMCRECGQRDIAVAGELVVRAEGQTEGGIPASWVRRIDPLTEPTDSETDREVTAT